MIAMVMPLTDAAFYMLGSIAMYSLLMLLGVAGLTFTILVLFSSILGLDF